MRRLNGLSKIGQALFVYLFRRHQRLNLRSSRSVVSFDPVLKTSVKSIFNVIAFLQLYIIEYKVLTDFVNVEYKYVLFNISNNKINKTCEKLHSNILRSVHQREKFCDIQDEIVVPRVILTIFFLPYSGYFRVKLLVVRA